MKQLYLSKLRDKDTLLSEFRHAAQQLSYLLAAEISSSMKLEQKIIETPLGKASGATLREEPILIPILRAGLAMLFPFLEIFSDAKVGFFGMRRNEKSFLPEVYYENIPSLSPKNSVMILDPMIATAGSSIEAIKRLLQKNIPLSKISLVGIIAAQTGIDRLKKEFPSISIHVAATDPELNAQKFIVPGLGDFGDRFFGSY
ncbi:MAG: uracil phosphoribosyltransferase [Parachlamydiales bacterium]|nr:uracil phosphoribosyltransferase [Parachlamydiales bacterium]